MPVLINNNTEYNLNGYYGAVDTAATKACRAARVNDKWSLSVTFVTPDEIQAMNRRYRYVDKPTDVLSFPAGVQADDGETLLGDIIICFDQAYAQAKEYGNTARREVCFLTVHGTLHLLGYDHMDEAGEAAMIKKQKEIMGDLP